MKFQGAERSFEKGTWLILLTPPHPYHTQNKMPTGCYEEEESEWADDEYDPSDDGFDGPDSSPEVAQAEGFRSLKLAFRCKEHLNSRSRADGSKSTGRSVHRSKSRSSSRGSSE